MTKYLAVENAKKLAHEQTALLREAMSHMPEVYTICGHPAWSDAACQKCDGCRDGRAMLRRVLSAATDVVAFWENDRSALDGELKNLRAALDGK